MRKQFPLTLAWCLTHWKAQGMTLFKVKIAVGDKVAKSLGVGYTAASRVKHVRDLVFSPDLPDYDVFQNAKHMAAFRSRQRFELKLEARASETILNYASKRKDVQVKCEADRWEEKEAELALQLIDELKNVARTVAASNFAIMAARLMRTHGSGGRRRPILAFGWVRLAMLLHSG